MCVDGRWAAANTSKLAGGATPNKRARTQKLSGITCVARGFGGALSWAFPNNSAAGATTAWASENCSRSLEPNARRTQSAFGLFFTAQLGACSGIAH